VPILYDGYPSSSEPLPQLHFAALAYPQRKKNWSIVVLINDVGL
jgi:hypothetical protein